MPGGSPGLECVLSLEVLLGDLPGVVPDQRLGLGLADQAGGMLHAFAEQWRAVLLVVGVGGEDGDHAFLQQVVCKLLGRRAEASGYRGCRDLQQAALVEEGLEFAWGAHQTLVAFGVGDHRDDVARQQPGGKAFCAEGDFTVGEFQQQDFLALPLAEEGHLVLGDADHQLHAEAYFCGGADAQVDAGLFQAAGQLRQGAGDGGRGVVVATRVDMGCADQVGDAVTYRHACQGKRGFEVGRPVVDAREQVVVEVDHGDWWSGLLGLVVKL